MSTTGSGPMEQPPRMANRPARNRGCHVARGAGTPHHARSASISRRTCAASARSCASAASSAASARSAAVACRRAASIIAVRTAVDTAGPRRISMSSGSAPTTTSPPPTGRQEAIRQKTFRFRSARRGSFRLSKGSGSRTTSMPNSAHAHQRSRVNASFRPLFKLPSYLRPSRPRVVSAVLTVGARGLLNVARLELGQNGGRGDRLDGLIRARDFMRVARHLDGLLIDGFRGVVGGRPPPLVGRLRLAPGRPRHSDPGLSRGQSFARMPRQSDWSAAQLAYCNARALRHCHLIGPAPPVVIAPGEPVSWIMAANGRHLQRDRTAASYAATRLVLIGFRNAIRPRLIGG
jgi:hypothetical protein